MDMMIDLETLGKSPTAVIKQIGWAVFPNPVEGKPRVVDSGVIYVDLQSALDYGLKIDGSTFEWWMRQDKDSRALMVVPGVDLRSALSLFIAIVETFRPVRVWARGLDFDLGMLRHVFSLFCMEPPWAYNAGRDVRTLEELHWAEPPARNALTLHSAKDDAVHQALHVQLCLLRKVQIETPLKGRVVSVDFDGVIHSYKSGWRGATTIPDDPVEGALDWLRSLVVSPHKFTVAISSARSAQTGGIEAMRYWLKAAVIKKWFGATDEELAWVQKIEWPRVKPAGMLHVDDRCWLFRGTNFPSSDDIINYKSWVKKDA